jgi:hypothetical protein
LPLRNAQIDPDAEGVRRVSAEVIISFIVGVLFGGPSGAVVGHYLARRGKVLFTPSEWSISFWQEASPSPILIGDIYTVPPERAGHAQCTFTVEIFSSKGVDTVLRDIAAVFHLSDGDTCKAKIHDPSARRDLTSLPLPARQQIRKELWINVLTSDVGREVMKKLSDIERVMFTARFPSGRSYEEQIYPTQTQRSWWRRWLG